MIRKSARLFFRVIYVSLIFLNPIGEVHGQLDTLTWSIPLEEVEITAYKGSNFLSVPASIVVSKQASLDRFHAGNILPVINTISGVKMEERSPGSYRLNIRGSSVRSPYGVRNVKIYFGDIPFTSPGGASMLNMLGEHQMSGFEVIKSPGNSMYGSGTGGVLLLTPPKVSSQPTLRAGFTAGSYNRYQGHVAAKLGRHIFSIEHFQSKSFREHSAIRRNVGLWTGALWQGKAAQLSGLVLMSDLFYETPGALTLTEYMANPKAARPATGAFPGAVETNASIRQQAALMGLTWRSSMGPRWDNSTAIYAFVNQTQNPTIQNYERKREPHMGVRSTFHHNILEGSPVLQLTTGVEWQRGISRFQLSGNRGGSEGDLFSKDQLYLNMLFGFGQLTWEANRWLLTTGGSIASAYFRHARTAPVLMPQESIAFHAILSPRFSALYRFSGHHAAFLNVARGFSPPTSAELFADDAVFNPDLQPELCWNFEGGMRGHFMEQQWVYDVNIFKKFLTNSIVTRRDAGGGNYYVNAGESVLNGIEVDVRYHIRKASHAWNQSGVGITYSLNDFKYSHFVNSGKDFSGNFMPGSPPHTFTFLLDGLHRSGWSMVFTASQMAGFPLNDANDINVGNVFICSGRISYSFVNNNPGMRFFFGANNIGNRVYSLGYDINGFGGRYFNAAPGRNFYAGFSVKWFK